MTKSYRALFAEAEEAIEYWTEIPITEFLEDINRLMSEGAITRAELARRIDAKPSYVTKILRGNANFTMTTMVKLARALNSAVHVHVAPRDVAVNWTHESLDSNAGDTVYSFVLPATHVATFHTSFERLSLQGSFQKDTEWQPTSTTALTHWIADRTQATRAAENG